MESERVEGYNQSNDGYTTAGVVQLRLDTAPMLDSLEAFLRGRRVVGYQETPGGIVPVLGKSGIPKMNDEGVQSVMSWLSPMLSAHTVQGNFKAEDYDAYIEEIDINFRQMIMTNLHNWEIKIEDYDTICNQVIIVSIAFFSRTIDNKERESYSNTIRTVESNRYEKGGGMLGMFKD